MLSPRICFVHHRRRDPPCYFSATNNNGDQKISAVRECFFIEKAEQKQERVCKGGLGSRLGGAGVRFGDYLCEVCANLPCLSGHN